MKLEPVYLLAPEPEKPGPTRRMLLAASVAAFVGGGLLGGTTVAAWMRSDASANTSDPHLEWALGAAKGPLADLAAGGHAFARVLRHHPEDEVLREGARRLATYLCDETSTPDRESLARTLLALQQVLEPPILPTSLEGRLRRVSGR